MKKSVVLGLVAVALAASCTVVAPGNPDGGKNTIIPIPLRPDALPPPRALEASVLVVANLERSSANLADRYAQVILGLATYLEKVGLKLANMGLIATYGDHYGPRLLLGRRAGTEPGPALGPVLLEQLNLSNITDYDRLLPWIVQSLGNISDADLPIALKLLAGSGHFDGDGETSEAKNVIGFGRGLNAEPLPPLLGGIERSALFDEPRQMFIVLYLQPLPRRCAMDTPACQIDGRRPTDIFLETDAKGDAAWLKFAGRGIKPAQVLHVAVATTEAESLDAFRLRCGQVPGFPRTLFDVMSPSQNRYFGPLMAELNAVNKGTGNMGDFCELIGERPDAAIMKLGTGVAGVLGAH